MSFQTPGKTSKGVKDIYSALLCKCKLLVTEKRDFSFLETYKKKALETSTKIKSNLLTTFKQKLPRLKPKISLSLLSKTKQKLFESAACLKSSLLSTCQERLPKSRAELGYGMLSTTKQKLFESAACLKSSLLDTCKEKLPKSRAELDFSFLRNFRGRFPKSRGVYLALPALIVAGFLVITTCQPDACAVLIDGKEVALVNDREAAEKVFQDISADFSSEQEVFVEAQVSFDDVRLNGRDVLSEEELRKLLLSALDFKCKAVAITVDGKAVAWVKNDIEAEKVIKRLKHSFCREDCELLSVRFLNDLAYEDCTVSAGKVMEVNNVVSLLWTGSEKAVTHTIAEGESLWTIARNNDTHVEDILAANPGLTEDSVLKVGSAIKLNKTEPLVHADAVYKKTVVSALPFATEYVKDPKLKGGQMKVKQEGQNGEKEIVYRFRTRDGVKVGQEKLSATVLKEPVKKIVARGDSPVMTVASRSTGGGSGGRLKWPTSAGRISQGYRGGHRAIDIDGNTGDPVVAADGGTVSFAGWSGGYGKCIIINHGNGLKTRYAHCSSLSVSAGDHVSRGQVIGKVGSTGRSTGSHLHFEVISGGSCVNPMNYLR